jgi:hypothetical protein
MHPYMLHVHLDEAQAQALTSPHLSNSSNGPKGPLNPPLLTHSIFAGDAESICQSCMTVATRRQEPRIIKATETQIQQLINMCPSKGTQNPKPWPCVMQQ